MDLGFHYDYFNGRAVNVEVEHRLRILHQVNVRYVLRERIDPYAISVGKFQRIYRLPQHEVHELAGIISPYVRIRQSPNALPLDKKLLCALDFYASGSYQRVVGRAASFNICQASVSNCIAEITNALNHPDIMSRFIHFPSTLEEREETMQRNFQLLGMPRCLGFIDGTLVKIVPPAWHEHKEAFYCRKGCPAINVEIVNDADLYIMSVNAKYPGSCNDPFIYRNSGVRDEMERAYRESRCWLLGDSIYPEEPWLHKPIPNALPGTPEYAYTKLHCHCRNAAERCIGVLKGRWRCLLSDRTLHYSPVKAGKIVNACVVLHNFCCMKRIALPPLVFEDNGHDPDEIAHFDVPNGNRQLMRLAEQERQYLINYAYARRY